MWVEIKLSGNTRKLNILFITPHFVPAWQFGGVVRDTYETAKQLVDKGHNVTVFTTNANTLKNQIMVEKSTIDGIKVRYLQNLNTYLAIKYKMIFPRKFRTELNKVIAEYDIIHVQGFFTIMTLWSKIFATKYQKPFIISPKGEITDYTLKNKQLLKRVLLFLIFKILKGVDAIVAQTEAEKNFLKKYNIKNISIINAGINIHDFDASLQKNNFRRKFHINDNEIVILYLGRINEIKGLKYLVKAIYALKNPNVRLFIIGPDDNYLNTLNKIIGSYKIQQQITIINGLYGEEKVEAYRGADIFCLPSIYDCAPNSLLEAAACELPIITTTTNGLNDIIKRGSGIVVPPRNAQALKDAIETLIQDKFKMQQMGKLGKEIVEKEYRWEFVTSKLEDLYYAILVKNSAIKQ